ncbi:MAG: ATP-binding protein [Acetobacteraceae bacterium]|nr:ATP-binding protein [Acetobacteraceae bacterium]MDW8399284.1 ATP-binding protein [Acetobacteraceae bacterium]
MESALALLLLFVLALAGAAVALVALLRLSAARAEAAAQLAERERLLSLAMRDLQGAGLALLEAAFPLGEQGEEIAGQARRLLRIADDIEEKLGAGAGPRRVAEGRVPLGPLVARAIAEVSVEIAPARRVFRADPALSRVMLRADSRALAGALARVLLRAARGTTPGEVVDIRLEDGPQGIALVVEDEGAGQGMGDLMIPWGEGGAPAGGTRGLPLGLSVARDLLRAHGGDLTVEAVEGIGSRCWLWLPRHRVLAPAPPQQPTSPQPLAA